MKLVKSYKGFKIKQATERDKKNGATSEYYIFHKDDNYYAEWECDSIEECVEWIDCY